MCFIVRQVVLSFCNCVTMQVSNNVSNLALWACIKRRRRRQHHGDSSDLFVVQRRSLIKMMTRPDENSEPLLCWWLMVMNQWWHNERCERETNIYISSSIYQRDIWVNCSGWERCFCGLCNCPVWLETDNILTGAYQTPSAVSGLLLLVVKGRNF